MANALYDRKAVRTNSLGLHVLRAAAVHTGAANIPIFTVVGGRCVIKSIVGQVTVGASGATNISLRSAPTVGTAAALCAVLAAGALEVGTLLAITGAVGGAMLGVSAGGVQEQATGVIVPVGTVDCVLSAAETISVQWDVFFVPLDEGAYITAV